MTHDHQTHGALSVPGRYLWDPWPVQDPAGSTVRLGEGELWVALVCDDSVHPDERHDLPRQHLLLLTDELTDLGPLFGDDSTPGSREWSGSTIYDAERGMLTAYYTAAGRRAEHDITFEQRLFVAEGTVDLSYGFQVSDWGPHRELVRPEPPYLASGKTSDAPDRWLHAFRDPGWFRDPITGESYLLFAASVDDPEGGGPWGAVGLARREHGQWVLQPPVVTSTGWNRELERPHVIWRDGRYYLFLSTQEHTFVETQGARTGLYGYVASAINGPYMPVNGNGLILANPAARPHEAYAWTVLEDLRVTAFLNYPDEPPGAARPGEDARFAGGFAPFRRLCIAGDEIFVEDDREARTA